MPSLWGLGSQLMDWGGIKHSVCNRGVPKSGFVVVQSPSCVWVFATPWIAACQAPLPFTISQSLLRFMSIESMTLPNHLNFCHPLLLLPSIFLWVIRPKHDFEELMKNWCFQIVVLTSESPLVCEEINPVKEINLEYSLEGLMLRRQYFGHPMQRAD